MPRFTVRRWLRSLVNSQPKTIEKKPRLRLVMEELESRLAPAATFKWDGHLDAGGASANNNWSTDANWVGDKSPLTSTDPVINLQFQAGATQLINVNDLPA